MAKQGVRQITIPPDYQLTDGEIKALLERLEVLKRHPVGGVLTIGFSAGNLTCNVMTLRAGAEPDGPAIFVGGKRTPKEF